MVADINDINVFIGPAEEQIQQDVKAFCHVLCRLVHGAGNVHQAEHHRLT